ncbi:amidohydrolase family protein [Taklimakanibacter lacteus]|uniref:amidohydrolase family protein n=1 Tax=Taklimakanibacter lacteus TaxID=2268456 RepID=UPI000E664BDF
MPIETLPLIDHHCHGISPAQLDWKQFQALFSESYRPPPPGTNEFQKPLGLAIRSFCAPLLDLEPHVSGEAYVEKRLALGAAEVNRRLMRTSHLDCLIVDTGHRSSAIHSFEETGALAGRPAHEVVRIEAIIEEVAATGVSAENFARAFADRLAERSAGAVGLKSIVAYRCTFAIPQSAPAPAEIVKAVGAWMKASQAAGKFRIGDPTVIRHGLWVGAEICRAKKLPLQLHVGFGDPDIYMHACDPTHFTDFIAAMEKWQVPITLLHNWPFLKEAQWLSEVFENVYYDAGVILNYGAAESENILREALQIGKFQKFLFSTDAFGLSELYYLGAFLFRRAFQRILDSWIRDGFCSAKDADEIAALVARTNARRIYQGV